MKKYLPTYIVSIFNSISKLLPESKAGFTLFLFPLILSIHLHENTPVNQPPERIRQTEKRWITEGKLDSIQNWITFWEVNEWDGKDLNAWVKKRMLETRYWSTREHYQNAIASIRKIEQEYQIRKPQFQMSASPWQLLLLYLKWANYLQRQDLALGYLNAKSVYEKAGAIINHTYSKKEAIIARHYYLNYANLLTRLGAYESAQSLFAKGYDYLITHKPQDEYTAALILLDWALNYEKQGRYSSADSLNNLVLLNANSSEQKAKALIGKAALSRATSDYEGSARSLVRAGQLLKQHQMLEATPSYLIPDWYAEQGFLSQASGKPEKAIKAFHKAIQADLYQSENQLPGRSTVGYYIETGNTLLAKGDWKQAAKYFDQALANLIHPQWTWENLPPDTFLFPENMLFLTYQGIAQTYETIAKDSTLDQSRQIQSLVKAVQTRESMARIDSLLREIMIFESSSVKLLQEGRLNREKLVQLTRWLYTYTGEVKWLEKAMNHIEKSKATLTFQKRQFQKYTAPVPKLDSLIRNLRDSIATLETVREICRRASQDTASVGAVTIQKQTLRIHHLQNSIRLLHEKIDKQYPNNKTLIKAPPYLRLAAIQKAIPDQETCILEYYYAQDSLWLILIRKQAVEFQTIPFGKDRKADLEQFRRLASDPHFGGYARSAKQIQEFASLGYTAGKWLFGTIWEQIQRGEIRTLTIIPDQHLYSFPFEALSTDIPQKLSSYNEIPFLMKAVNFNQELALSIWMERKINSQKNWKFWQHQSVSQKKQSIPFTILAPEIPLGDLTAIDNISFTKDSICYPVAHLKITNAQANKASYTNFAPRSEILLVYTHGLNDTTRTKAGMLILNGSTPQKLDTLHAHEIEAQPHQTKLVLLLTCLSGTGKVVPEEGLYSIGQAYIRSGADAVINSTWNLKEHKGRYLYKRTLKYFGQGTPANKALSQAKRDALEQFDNFHPYYWAGVTLIGNTKLSE